ncbi:MAG: hypothetical protein ABSF32_03825 [Ignavibacteria bacterium]|jgi:hypothetical protein
MKLFDIIRSLSNNEFKRLGEFVTSPYFNKNKNLISLYKYLYTTNFTNNNHSISKRDVYDYVFPSEKYNDTKIRLLFSNFTKLLEKYVSLIQNEKDIFNRKIQLLDYYRERSVNKPYLSLLQELKDTKGDVFTRNNTYYYNRIILEREILESKIFDIVLNLDNSYKAISTNHDLYFIVSKLQIAIFMYNHSLFLNEDLKFDIWALDAIIKYISENKKEIRKDHPLIYMDYLCLMMLTRPDEEIYYFELKKYFEKNSNKLRLIEYYHIANEVKNYCIRKINYSPRFNNETSKISKALEMRGAYNDSINHIDFFNIIQHGLNMKDMAWVEYFFAKYKSKLEPKYRPDIENISEAYIYFYKKEYEKALQRLQKVSYQNIHLYLMTKVLTIRSYYELKENESCLYTIDAMKHFIKRHEDKIGYYHIHFTKFLLFVKKLINLNRSSKTDVDILKKEILTEKDIASKDWLLLKASGSNRRR